MWLCMYLYSDDDPTIVNPFPPEGCGCDFTCINFKQNLAIDVLIIQVNIGLNDTGLIDDAIRQKSQWMS